jgi:hypothetical protein
MVSAQFSIPTGFVAHGIGPFLALQDNDRGDVPVIVEIGGAALLTLSL